MRVAIWLAGLATACGTVATPRQVEQFRAAHADFAAAATSRPPVQLVAARYSDAKLDEEPGSFDLDELRLEATAPLPLGRDGFLVAGLALSRRDYDFEGTPVADDTLSYYGLRLGYGRFVHDDLVIQGYWQPSAYSDFDGTLNSRDWRLWYGDVLAVWRKRPDLYWKLGARFSDALDTGVIPLIGCALHVTERLSLEALLPRDAIVVWRPRPEWEFSVGMANQSDEYHLRGPRSVGEPEHDVHVQESVLFLGAQRRWNEHLATFLQLGTTVKGEYDWDYGGGFQDYDGELEPTSVLLLGLGYWF